MPRKKRIENVFLDEDFEEKVQKIVENEQKLPEILEKEDDIQPVIQEKKTRQYKKKAKRQIRITEYMPVNVKRKPVVINNNLEIFKKIESCPFCGSHAGHLSKFGIYLQCGICKTRFYKKESTSEV